MRSHRLFILFSRALAGALIFTSVILGALLGRLYIEPVDLTFLTPKLEKFLEKESEGVTVSFNSPKLRWKGMGHSLEIFAQDLDLKTPRKTGLSAKIPRFYLTFRFRNLLYGEFLPSILTLEEPKIRYESLMPREKKPVDVDNVGKNKIIELVSFIFESSNRSKILKRLRLIRADAFLDLGEEMGQWHLPELTFVLNRKQGFIDGLCDFSLEDNQKMAVSFAFFPQDKKWKIDWDVESLSIPFWAKKPSIARFFPNGLDHSDLTIKGEVKVNLSEKFAVTKAGFSLSSKKGILSLSESLPRAQPFQNLNIEGSFTPKQGLNTEVSLETRKASIKGLLQLSPVHHKKELPDFYHQFQEAYSLDLKAELQNFSVAYLGGYWPEKAAPPARKWLVENLYKGLISKGTFNLKGHLTLGSSDPKTHESSFSLKSLNGDIFLDKGTLRYVETMPEVTSLSAHAFYDQNHFSIQVKKGTNQGLNLQKGHVLISGFQDDNQDIKIEASAIGPLSDALSIINSKPLSVLEGTAVDSAKTEGKIRTDLVLSFPLDDRFTGNNIQFSAEASVEQAAIPRVFDFLPISLSESNLSVSVNNENLSVSGKSSLNRLPSVISWKQSLKNGTQEVTVNLSATPSFIKSLGVEVAQYLKGALPSTIVYNQLSSENSTLKVDVDLSPGHLTIGPWSKESKKSGTLTSKWLFQGGALHRLESIKVKTSDLLFDMTADFNKDLSFKSAKLNTFKWGNTELTGSLFQGKDVDYKVTLEGASLDLARHLESLKDDNSTDFDLDKNFDLRMRVPQITLSHNQSFYQNSLSLRFLNNRVHSAAYKGFLDTGAEKEFYIDILPRSNNGRRLRLKCQDAGYMLKALNFFDDVSEGKLKLTANQADDEPETPWDGKLEIHSFWLEKAPVISRLLSLAFPTGLVSAFSEKGLPFDRLKIKFKKKKSNISLYRGRAYSPSFGFSVNGSIKDSFSVLNLHGTVYPAYFFNTIFSRIPLLGQLLTGGKHEGIWGVSYTITGPSNSPNIKVNPLTAFAPGIFRKIFLPTEEDDFDEEDDTDISEEPTLE